METIIGGGLSGLAAGIKLLKSGHNVSIFEQNSDVGSSIGRDAMAIRNYGLGYDQLDRFNKLGIKIKNVKPIHRIIKYSPSGKEMEVYSENDPLFYVILRDNSENKNSLDSELLNEYVKQGGKISFKTRKSLSEGNIIATRNIYSSYWAVGKEYVDVDVDPETILFFMDNRYAPQGYLTMIPWGRHEISFGVAVFDSPDYKQKFDRPLFDLLDKFINTNNIVSKILEKSTLLNYGGGSAYSNIPKTAKVKNKLFVGSAAGFLDAARGFGVKYAIESGVFAGQSIAEKVDYDVLWKNSFEKELLKNFARRLVLGRMNNNDYEDLLIEGKLPVSKYDNFPDNLKKFLSSLEVSFALNNWRKKFDLNKLC